GPAAAYLPVGLAFRWVAVGFDPELQARLLRRARVHVAKVEPVGLTVDLEEAARCERTLDDPLDVDLARAARADPPAGEMPDAVDVGVLHGLEHALGRPVLRRVVHRGDDPVEPCELVLRHVDLAGRADARLEPP